MVPTPHQVGQISRALLRLTLFVAAASSFALHAYGATTCQAIEAKEYEASHQDVLRPRVPKGKLKFVEKAASGANEGGWYVDQIGERWLIKADRIHPELQSGAEVVSSIIYRYLGYAAASSVILTTPDGRRVSATRSLGEGLKGTTLQEGFTDRYFRQLRYFAAYLKDWDRLRLGPNNFDLGGGRFAMFDFGGTLGSRAQGEHKPGAVLSRALGAIEGDWSFDQIVSDFRVDWLPKGHAWQQELTLADAKDLVRKFLYLTDNALSAAVHAARYSNPEDSAKLRDVLVARRDAMIKGLERFIAQSGAARFSTGESDSMEAGPKPPLGELDLRFVVEFYERSGYRKHQVLAPQFEASYQALNIEFHADGSCSWNKDVTFERQLGSGSNGEVFLGKDGAVYKLAAEAKKAPALQMEQFVNADLKANYDRFGIRVDEILEAGDNGAYLKKRYYDPRQLGHNIGRHSDIQIKALRRLFNGAVRYAKERGIGLDIKSENLWWNGEEWVLIDCGPRLGFRPFGYTLDIGSFDRFLQWWNAGQGAPLSPDGRSKTIDKALADLDQNSN